jgi:hypothetical protein
MNNGAKIFEASKRQTWAIFCASGYDVRDCHLTPVQASQLLDDLNQGKPFDLDLYPYAVLKKVVKQKQDWQALYDKAHKAGMINAVLHQPTPMVVVMHEDMFNDDSPIKYQEEILGGVCGFAWIKIRPANCSFANWCRKQKLGSTDYNGGLSIWVHEFGQSMERKEKYAQGFADVLREVGIKAYADSRMD